MNATSYLLTWILVVGYAILNATGALIIKYKISQMGPVSFETWPSIFNYFFKLLTSPLVMGGLASIFLSAFIWIAALSRIELSTAYPAAVGLNFLFVLLFAFTLFGEAFTINRIIASLLIIMSIYLLYKS